MFLQKVWRSTARRKKEQGKGYHQRLAQNATVTSADSKLGRRRNMALHYTAYMSNKSAKFRYTCGTDMPKSLEERKLLFPVAARALVSGMLHGMLDIREEDIQLEAGTGIGGDKYQRTDKP